MPQLLSRQAFKEAVFKRQQNTCAFCDLPCVDAHHLIERKLWADGGYYLDNGVGVCEAHHWLLETTALSPRQAREACGINTVLLPPEFDPRLEYDKWGNIIISETKRLPGRLFHEASVQKVMKDVLHLFEESQR
jgi:hypothetical protein